MPTNKYGYRSNSLTEM